MVMPELSPPAILYADDALIVAVKPAGLLCVPGRGADKQDCLSQRVQLQYPDALIVHRLDMATSGLCAMARGADAQRQLSQAFASREVHKRYEALVHGEFDQIAARKTGDFGDEAAADGAVGWQIVWSDAPEPKPGQKVSKKRVPPPLQALGFTLDELRDARLAPIVSFKGRGASGDVSGGGDAA